VKNSREWKNGPDGMKIVKCGCGLIMRQKHWEDHWRVCGTACGVDVTEQDVTDLLAYERTPLGSLKRDERVS